MNADHHYSKYFELLFYRPKALLPPRSEDLCEHLEQDDHSFTWCFSRDNTTVEIGLEPVSLYELRLPASEHPVSSTKSYRLDFDLEPTGDANDTEENVVRLSLQQEIVTFYAQLQFGIQAVK